jgi:pimeloyl-ACP methyl ester carboxylesterase
LNRIPTEFEDLGDMRLAYMQHGSGPDLILLHGNYESKSTFGRYLTDHFPTFHTWALDSRCHGESQSHDSTLTIEQISDDIIRFCQIKGIKKAYVIGYSDGGNVALFLAKKAPQLFTRIIAISPNTLVSGITPDTLIKYGLLSWILKIVGVFKQGCSNRAMIIDLMLRDIGLSFADLGTITTRMKIIYAEREMIKEKHIKDIAAAIPGCELEKVMGCNHISIVRAPAAIKIMQEYLNGK